MRLYRGFTAKSCLLVFHFLVRIKCTSSHRSSVYLFFRSNEARGNACGLAYVVEQLREYLSTSSWILISSRAIDSLNRVRSTVGDQPPLLLQIPRNCQKSSMGKEEALISFGSGRQKVKRCTLITKELERSYTLSTPGGSSPVCCPPCSPPPAPAAYISSARASSRRLGAGSGLGGPTSPERDPLGRLLSSLTARRNPYFSGTKSSFPGPTENLIPLDVFLPADAYVRIVPEMR
ncbi:hypothetical protein DBV15_03326 [Temnothorax longispinosus]|uniref:Uncharacterized protein n=1 Tax=Temnothorax longispinosus TaxID=300112 RepID=A0A4S2JP35_9HYME|nr:hypothetical protein DBV15_03326 [Temnothorax longispinosus]